MLSYIKVTTMVLLTQQQIWQMTCWLFQTQQPNTEQLIAAGSFDSLFADTEVNGSIIEITWAKPAKDKNQPLQVEQLPNHRTPAFTSSSNLPSANLQKENLPSPF